MASMNFKYLKLRNNKNKTIFLILAKHFLKITVASFQEPLNH